jgi:hypothetical protein
VIDDKLTGKTIVNTPTTMTITIERTPRTMTREGVAIQVEELSVRLPFARKPVDLNEVGGYGDTKIFVTETREMTPMDFDSFASNLMKSRDWLRGKGGGTEGGYFCVEVCAPGRPYLYVNPEGGDYARYVAAIPGNTKN